MRNLLKAYKGFPDANGLLTEEDLHWARVFKWNRGVGFRIATPTHADKSGNDWLRDFVKTFGPAIVMPLTFMSKGLGFGARSIKGKRFSANLAHVPGFFTPSTCFEQPFVYGTPIMVTEGVLDAEVASLAYPWTLAALTSKISEVQAFLLSLITNTVIFSFDNDEAGEKGYRYSQKNMKRWGLQHTDLRPSGVKDWGDLLGKPKQDIQDELNRFAVTLRVRGIVR